MPQSISRVKFDQNTTILNDNENLNKLSNFDMNDQIEQKQLTSTSYNNNNNNNKHLDEIFSLNKLNMTTQSNDINFLKEYEREIKRQDILAENTLINTLSSVNLNQYNSTLINDTIINADQYKATKE